MPKVQKFTMHPHLYRLFTTGTLALSNLIFMMRKAQVDTSGVDIELLAQVLGCHGRALYMPAGEANTPGAGPVHLTALIALFPQSEVFRRVFIFGNLHLLAAMTTSAQVLDCIT